MDLTVYGGHEPWEDSAAGWPRADLGERDRAGDGEQQSGHDAVAGSVPVAQTAGDVRAAGGSDGLLGEQ